MLTLVQLTACLLTAGYGFFLLVQRYYWGRIETFIPDQPSGNTKLSVIIAMRNEEANITACLESLRLQDYPMESVEVLVMDDHSQDNSVRQVKEFIRLHPGGIQVSLYEIRDSSKRSSYKKYAISEGIRHAKGEVIITTDADCVAGPRWLSTLASCYEKYHPVMIMGPVQFRESSGFFNRLQTFEFAGLIGMGAASARSGYPLMCNGANLAYTRKAFNEINGFGNTPELASGDDTFLLFKLKDRYPDGICFLKSREAIITTSAQESLKAFFHQRKRWASKTTRYQKPGVTWTGLTIYFFNFFLLLTGMLSIFFNSMTGIFLLMAGVKLLLEFSFMAAVCKFFRKEHLLWIFLPAALLNVPYTLLVGLVAPLGGYRWKGRNMK